MVFYNNVLSIVFLLPICLLEGEYTMWFNQDMLSSRFIVLNVLAGLFGCALNFAVVRCVHIGYYICYRRICQQGPNNNIGLLHL
jgi:hypothetical protein